MIKKSAQNKTETEYDFIDKNDIIHFEQLLGWSSINQYNILEQQKSSLEKEIASLPNLKIQLLDLRKNDMGGSEDIIQSYDANELKIKEEGYHLMNSKLKSELIITIPDTNLNEIDINTGAGNLNIDSINTEKLDIDLGTGTTLINNLFT